MAAAKWQQANGAKKMRKRTAKNVQKQTAPEKRNARKSAKPVENERKQAKNAKTIGVFFGDRSLAIFQWPYSGGHLGFPYFRSQGSLNHWVVPSNPRGNINSRGTFAGVRSSAPAG